MKPFYNITLVGLALLVAATAMAQEPTLPPAVVTPPKGTSMTVLLDDYSMIRCRVEIDDKDGTYHLYDGDVQRDLPAKRVLFAGTSDAEVRYYMMMSVKQNSKTETRDRSTIGIESIHGKGATRAGEPLCELSCPAQTRRRVSSRQCSTRSVLLPPMQPCGMPKQRADTSMPETPLRVRC